MPLLSCFLSKILRDKAIDELCCRLGIRCKLHKELRICFSLLKLIRKLSANRVFLNKFHAIIGLLTVAAVSLCSYVALFQFFTLCQRLKNGTAFTAANEKALHRIALCCGFSAAALCIAFIIALFYGGFYLAFLELLLLFIAAYLCVSLVAYALELLLRRATAIQEENDLTI